MEFCHQTFQALRPIFFFRGISLPVLSCNSYRSGRYLAKLLPTLACFLLLVSTRGGQAWTAACSDDGLLLSQNGVPVTSLPVPIRSGESGETVITESVLSRRSDIPYNQGTLDYPPMWYFNWSMPYDALIEVQLLNAAQFRAAYGGSPAGCAPPQVGTNGDVVFSDLQRVSSGRWMAFSLIYFIAWDDSYRQCAPFKIYFMARLTGIESATGAATGAVSWLGQQWVKAADSTSPLCRNSSSGWAYTAFEVAYCPCESLPPPSPSPPFLSPPSPPPPRRPLPPPPQRNGVSSDDLLDSFPFSACTAREVAASPYRMSAPRGPFNITSVTSTYCFRVTRGWPFDPAWGCGGMALNKIEFVIDADCLGTAPIKRSTVNGVTVFPISTKKEWRGGAYGVLGFSRLASLFPTFPRTGLNLCLALGNKNNDGTASGCGTPAGLCYNGGSGGADGNSSRGSSCVYSLFNTDRTCCPVGLVSA